MSTVNDSEYVFRGVESLIEIRLVLPDNFLKVKETLSRIGIPSYKDKKLYQSCHILQKKGKFYIVHFKELFALDGKENTMSEEDWSRRNTIANLLEDWGLIEIVNETQTEEPVLPLSKLKIIKFAEKSDWQLVPKYLIGVKKKTHTTDPYNTST